MRTDDRLVQTTPKDGATRAGRRQIGAHRGAMMEEEETGEEDSNRTAGRLWAFAKADAVAAGQRREEPHVVEDGVDGRPTSVMTKR